MIIMNSIKTFSREVSSKVISLIQSISTIIYIGFYEIFGKIVILKKQK